MSLGEHGFRFEVKYEKDPKRLAEKVAEHVNEVLKKYEGRADVANIKMLLVVTFEDFSPLFKAMEFSSFKEPLNVADAREKLANEVREWLAEQLSNAQAANARLREIHLSISIESNPYRSWVLTL